jgi:hypothetical protein
LSFFMFTLNVFFKFLYFLTYPRINIIIQSVHSERYLTFPPQLLITLFFLLVVWEGMDWIRPAQDSDQCRAFVKMVTNLRFQ